MENTQTEKKAKEENKKKLICYCCGEAAGNIKVHREKYCKGVNNMCNECNKMGHLSNVCRQKKVNQIQENLSKTEQEAEGLEETGTAYNINIFRIKSNQVQPK